MKLWIISATIEHKPLLLRVSLLLFLEKKEFVFITSPCASVAWIFPS